MFVIIGTANVDLLVSGFDKMPGGGSDEFTTNNLVFCDDPLQLMLGGNGGNCAYVLAGLGAPTALCSAAGQDALGDYVHSWLAERHVDLTGFVRHSHWATAFTTIVMDNRLNRLAFHHPGALAALTYADLPRQLLQSATSLLVTSYPIMPGLRPVGFAQVLAEAHARGTITAIDIGPAIGQPAYLAELAPLLPSLDYVIANRHELTVCTGVEDLEHAASILLKAGARCLIVKLGKAGALIRTTGLHTHVPGFAVTTHSTVGAGDSFNAGLLYGLQQHWPIETAARFGNAVAALVVSSAQGVLGSPTLGRVEAFLREMD
ncbi:MAG: carbohydrate kinase family protein [Chloroflexi bacterium]|nr:carbohydrate kinase family protein [Chloroflexota bacterium]